MEKELHRYMLLHYSIGGKKRFNPFSCRSALCKLTENGHSADDGLVIHYNLFTFSYPRDIWDMIRGIIEMSW